jgi:hypothetical protein
MAITESLPKIELPLEAYPGKIAALDESEGGWCSDAPRPRPRSLDSWLDYDTEDSQDKLTW